MISGGFLGIWNVEAKSLQRPKGIIPKLTESFRWDFMMPFTISWIVPSPPQAMIESMPFPTALDAIVSAWPAPVVHSTEAWIPDSLRESSNRGSILRALPRPLIGFAINVQFSDSMLYFTSHTNIGG